MNTSRVAPTIVALVSLMLYASGGCDNPASSPPTGGSSESSAEGEHGHAAGDSHDGRQHEEGDAHEHATEGPHGGNLVELGNEEYHAEVMHDEAAGSISIYLLDGSAKASVAIDAVEILVNVKHDGKGEQFKLTASPDASDPPSKSSRFVSTDGELIGDLDHEHADAELVVEINGKPYRGAIEHHHGHEETDHAEHAHQ